MARELGVSAMAVRQHLYEMLAQKIATYEERPRSVGRPTKFWRLTPEADDFFPNGHAELALSLIQGIRTSFGEDGIRKLLKEQAVEQTKSYRKQLGGCRNLSEKLERLSEIRTEEGYMAEVHKEAGDGFLLVENHCPICSAARSCTGLCGKELEVFCNVLGETVSIERTEHILTGARRCAYRVRNLAE